jgi:imidazolonepropionase-like amidohydrolase
MKGADFIKLYGTGSMMAKGSEPGVQIMDDDEILEAVRVAESKGSYCAMHAHGTKAIDAAVHCGVSTIEHASFIGEETLKYMDGRTDCGIVPTLATVWDIIENTDPTTDYGSYVIAKVKELVSEISSCLSNACKNHDVLVGWGTDTPMSAYLNDPGMEFRVRKQLLDCSNIDLLKQATINSAKIMRLDDSIGSIKEGKCADLIVLKGDPVADISVMNEKPVHVIKSGKLIG